MDLRLNILFPLNTFQQYGTAESYFLRGLLIYVGIFFQIVTCSEATFPLADPGLNKCRV